MQFCYRGINYQSSNVEFYTSKSESTAMYRGVLYKINEKVSRFGKKIKPSSTNLKYRGISYIRNVE
ncbi:MAG: DUF4278 domain-containing protein [Methylacidiphilales bacterium]|nr:DUF4278 domain-containing protein [Candidatus Methylacidiphilales bacterium]NJR17637.1 DUF4278 domain-containing protein [Calothrix sp. CSU_2_0]